MAMNRREFLDLRNLTQPAGFVRDLMQTPPQDQSTEPALLRFRRQAMATTFEVILPFATPRATEAAGTTLDIIDQMEDQLTIYRPGSEVSRLNERAGREAVTVEKNLFALLVLAG